MKDLFELKSKSWDMNSVRVKNANSIAELIVKNITLKPDMEIMDFGAGTGLLSFFISQKVGKVIAVDNSHSMLEILDNKKSEFACEVDIMEVDLSTESINKIFDGIISSMTTHHLEDTYALFRKLYTMLQEDGFIAIADLDTEDGSFHSDNTGVFHYGFDRRSLENIAKEAGFENIHFDTATKISKKGTEFTVFLMTAQK